MPCAVVHDPPTGFQRVISGEHNCEHWLIAGFRFVVEAICAIPALNLETVLLFLEKHCWQLADDGGDRQWLCSASAMEVRVGGWHRPPRSENEFNGI